MYLALEVLAVWCIPGVMAVGLLVAEEFTNWRGTYPMGVSILAAVFVVITLGFLLGPFAPFYLWPSSED